MESAQLKGASIQLLQLSVGYPGQPALCTLSGAFQAGSATAVMGSNGTGKSTLLRTLLGLQPILGGQLQWSGHSAKAAAWLPQLSAAQRDFPISLFDAVSTGHWHSSGALKSWGLLQRRATLAEIKRVGLQGLEKRAVSTLSGGQFQRMLFARLSVQNAPTLLLDEPLNNVDSSSQAILLERLQQWHAEGRTLIIVLHDEPLARANFPQLLQLTPPNANWLSTAHAVTAPLRAQQHAPEYLRESA